MSEVNMSFAAGAPSPFDALWTPEAPEVATDFYGFDLPTPGEAGESTGITRFPPSEVSPPAEGDGLVCEEPPVYSGDALTCHDDAQGVPKQPAEATVPAPLRQHGRQPEASAPAKADPTGDGRSEREQDADFNALIADLAGAGLGDIDLEFIADSSTPTSALPTSTLADIDDLLAGELADLGDAPVVAEAGPHNGNATNKLAAAHGIDIQALLAELEPLNELQLAEFLDNPPS